MEDSSRRRLLAAAFLALGALVVVAGQSGRDLLPPDDLREVEVAREMLDGGDTIIPHLAGLPFVEKPPAFPACVATAFRVAGGPSIPAARAVPAVFAIATLAAVFLLGRRALGPEAGAFAAGLLAVTSRFCRTAHEILLDNALAAGVAYAILFTWLALEAAEAGPKRRRYAAAALCLGLSFLVKGFVGPALFVSSFLLYLAASRRLRELRDAFRPLPAIAFLVPVLVWFVPFVNRATPELRNEFLVVNTLGRALGGHGGSPHRSAAYYVLDVIPSAAPASAFLLFAAIAAWRRRRENESRAALFFLAFAVGPLLLLSILRAKASVYLLPSYPALALLVAWWCAGAWRSTAPRTRAISLLLTGGVSLAPVAAAVATAILGGPALTVAAALVAAAAIALGSASALRRGDHPSHALGAVALLALAWTLFFTGPIAAREVALRTSRLPIERALALAGDRDVWLFRPDDALRGGAGFYRLRTAQEMTSPGPLVERLASDPHAVAILRVTVEQEGVPAELRASAAASGVELREEARVPYSSRRVLSLVSGARGESSR